MERKLLVKRGDDFSYPICFYDSFEALPDEMTAVSLASRQVCLVTDSNVGPLYREAVLDALRKVSLKVTVFTIPAGEENKKLSTTTEIYRHLIENGMDRKGLLAALGGGVTGDITGFAAATYLRGIDFIQLPTTLLSQVDSSVGGKTGVDLDQYKNMIGAFHQPRLVYMNLSALGTLPPEEIVCGMGEVLKTGLICDGAFFRKTVEEKERIISALTEAAGSPACKKAMEPLEEMIFTCVKIKADIVERDPEEHGERALLNLGHTVGHAVEKLMDFRLKHGQCVGLGILSAARISLNRGLLTPDEEKEIRAGLAKFGLPESVTGLCAGEVLQAAKKDKKMDQGRIRFILMKGIGKTFIDRSVSDEEILQGVNAILN